MSEYKKCLIVVNTSKEDSVEFGHLIQDFLSKRNIEARLFNFDGFSEEDPFSGNDFVITLGGDGTVLYAARGCVNKGIPVFPVNFGEFGFIASIQKNEWEEELTSFLNGNYEMDQRSMLKASLVSSEEDRAFTAIGLNDVVICAAHPARTINFEVTYNDVPLGQFKADGMIISTATGSTAYSSSAGGPIIDPELDALLLTPKNSFSLSSRPLVLSPRGEIGIHILPSRQNDVIITVDGQKPYMLGVGDVIKIRRLNNKINLIGCTTTRFYGALRSKLNWSGGPHA